MSFEPPPHWRRVTTIDAHTAGEPLRVVTGGYPELPGRTILEKRRYALDHLDHLRRALMWEPRGHADMYGCVLTPPVTADGDVGVVFDEGWRYDPTPNRGYAGLVDPSFTNEMAFIWDEAVNSDFTWKPRNYKETFYGPTLLRKALAKSRNLVMLYSSEYREFLGASIPRCSAKRRKIIR